MKKQIAMLLVLLLLFGCAGCGAETQTVQPTQEATQETAQETARTATQAAMDALNGKRIIFVGNSYTYFGQAVFSRSADDSNLLFRTGDTGYFYQLCKAMGMEVEVTNWTFGGHDLTDSLGSSCTHKHAPGTDHLSYLTDRSFDYVALQLYKEDEYAGDMNEHLQPLMDLFRAENPDVKFLLLVPHMAYDRKYIWVEDLRPWTDRILPYATGAGCSTTSSRERQRFPELPSPTADPPLWSASTRRTAIIRICWRAT